jgi:hypothetical protein
MKPGFYVSAYNIHTDAHERYGPFPGTPAVTYEFLRCEMTPESSGHIFMFSEDRGLAAEGWIDQEGERRTDGWRRCYDLAGSFGNEAGGWWTDLDIEPIRLNGNPPWEPNTHP